MKFVKQSNSKKIKASSSTAIWEYWTDDKDISGAIAKINGRYPEKGFATNQICKELVYVIEGKGILGMIGCKTTFQKGDSLLIDKDEKFYWEGNFSMYMATTPKFYPKQHNLVDS